MVWRSWYYWEFRLTVPVLLGVSVQLDMWFTYNLTVPVLMGVSAQLGMLFTYGLTVPVPHRFAHNGAGVHSAHSVQLQQGPTVKTQYWKRHSEDTVKTQYWKRKSKDTVKTQWRHSKCTVKTQRRHSKDTVKTQRRHSENKAQKEQDHPSVGPDTDSKQSKKKTKAQPTYHLYQSTANQNNMQLLWTQSTYCRLQDNTKH